MEKGYLKKWQFFCTKFVTVDHHQKFSGNCLKLRLPRGILELRRTEKLSGRAKAVQKTLLLGYKTLKQGVRVGGF